mgnify:FL=1|tara:strand:+ start:78 stop:257 length:180 start_codon:yes stop_codon:yes gene_type:complete
MRRYTDWLKQKMMCHICKREISRGHIHNHLKSKIHMKNARDLEDKENKKLSESVTITWD